MLEQIDIVDEKYNDVARPLNRRDGGLEEPERKYILKTYWDKSQKLFLDYKKTSPRRV